MDYLIGGHPENAQALIQLPYVPSKPPKKVILGEHII